MLNRRYIRVKVLQAVYAFYQDNVNSDVLKSEKEILKSIDKIYNLYLYVLAIFMELREMSEETMELKKKKILATEEDLNPNMRFLNNLVLNRIDNNVELLKLMDQQKISWKSEYDLIKGIYKEIIASEIFLNYMKLPEVGFSEDKKLMIDIFINYIADNELLQNYFEDSSIYWAEDIDLVIISVIKTIKQIKEKKTEPTSRILLSLYKDKEGDTDFLKKLFRRTISNKEKYENLIGEKAKKWDTDRIALLDMILMEMAVCEMENFESIPIKVTLNEYIELSKNYSTPKSKIFINGILDKLAIELQGNGTVVKTGRGLIT